MNINSEIFLNTCKVGAYLTLSTLLPASMSWELAAASRACESLALKIGRVIAITAPIFIFFKFPCSKQIAEDKLGATLGMVSGLVLGWLTAEILEFIRFQVSTPGIELQKTYLNHDGTIKKTVNWF